MDEIKFRLAAANRIKRAYRHTLGNPMYNGVPKEDIMNMLESKERDLWNYAMSDRLNFIKEHLEGAKLVVKYFSLNVRPDTSRISLASFVIMVHKYMKKNTIICGEYCFEQAGDSEKTMGDGFHFHANILHKRCYADFCKDAIKHFSECCDSNFVKFNLLKTEKDLTGRQHYIRKNITDKEKLAKAAWDKVWRQKHQLENLYSVGGGIKYSAP